MTMDLDTQMRVASHSLRRASRGLTPTGPPPTRRPPLAVAGMAVVVTLLLAVAGIAVLRLTDDDRSRVSTGIPDIPRLIPGAYPEGLPDPMGIDLPYTALFDDNVPASIAVYGDPGAESPFAAADLAVITSDNDIRPYVEGSGNQRTVTVRGVEGLSTEAAADSPIGRSVTWEADGRHVLVASHSLDEDQLLAVAEALTIAEGDVTLDAAPPGMPVLEQLAAADDYLLANLVVVGPPVRRSAEAFMVGNETVDYDKTFFVVTSAGDASDLVVVRWVTGADTPTEVRGHPAWAGTDDGAQSLVWEESPGVIAMVLANGLTDAELQAAVDSLRPATDDEWDQLPHEPVDESVGDPGDESAGGDTAGGEDPVAEDAYLTGNYSDGMWDVDYDPVSPALCASFVAFAGDDMPYVCIRSDEPASVLTDQEGTPILLFGLMPEGAVALGDPALLAAAQVTDTPDGRVLYAVVLDGQPAPTEVAFVDSQGQTVSTSAVATPALGTDITAEGGADG
jgi:hypothetical protein